MKIINEEKGIVANTASQIATYLKINKFITSSEYDKIIKRVEKYAVKYGYVDSRKIKEVAE